MWGGNVKVMPADNIADYLFCVERRDKDGFAFETKARNFKTGKFYDVRFNGRKKYEFFVFSGGRWHVYFMLRNANFCPESFKSAGDLLRLESDILSGAEKPYLTVRGTQANILRRRLSAGARIVLPDLPFLFCGELESFDNLSQKERYGYTCAPKYLIAARKTKYVKPGASESLYLFGCNNDRLYKQISPGTQLCVTHTYENERAVAVRKSVNRNGIIPMQHCLKKI